MRLVVLDIEVFRNYFLCICKHHKTNKVYIFEISNDKNDLYNFFYYITNKENWYVGYNVNDYDLIVIQYILENADMLFHAPSAMRNEMIYQASKKVINRNSAEGKIFINELKKKSKFNTIDLMTLLFPPKKQCSLKQLQVTLKFKNVFECEYDWDSPLKEGEEKEVKRYCLNDVESTDFLLVKCYDELTLRRFIKDTYDIECYSLDRTKTGVKFLATQYCRQHKLDANNFIFTKRPFYNIIIKDILYDCHKFETENCNKALEYFTNWEKPIVPKNDKTYINKRVEVNGKFFDLGCGGIHSVDPKGIITAMDDEYYVQSDIMSFYPCSILNGSVLSEFLDASFLDIYKNVLEMKKQADIDNNKLLREFCKFILNSYFGQLNSEFGPFFSPNSFFTITINGQFKMLKLIETLSLAGFQIISANTDSIDVKMKKDKYDEYITICNDWCNTFNYELTHLKIKQVIRNSCSDYIMQSENGEVKLKGQTFKVDLEIGKGYYRPIVKKAVVDYFINNTKVEDTILGCKDVLEFCMYEKTGKDYTVLYDEKKVQRTNRFYCSTNGKYLYKTKSYYNDKKGKYVTDKEIMINARVSILNDYSNKDEISTYNINYSWYLNAAKTIINEILFASHTLF